jgi:putative membrane protein
VTEKEATMRLLWSVSLLALAAAIPAWAQTGTGNPAGMAPGTVQTGPGIPAPGQLHLPDHSFAQAAALGGTAEVGLGQLAEKKGQSKAVSDFGRRMIADHGKANQQLDELAQAARCFSQGTPTSSIRLCCNTSKS